MNAPAYQPTPKSLAGRVIDYLKQHPDVESLDAHEIASTFGEKGTSGISTSLKRVVEAGLLGAERRGNSYRWFLPKPEEAYQPPELKMAFYSEDGSLSVTGCRILEDHVEFSGEQLQQLIAFLTRPRVVLPAVLAHYPV